MRKRKVVLFIAMSLDGFIASEDDSIDWLEAVEGLGDNGYKKFYNSVDTLIMGRRTFDWVTSRIASYPYQGKVSYVLTHHPLEDSQEVKFVKDSKKLVSLLQTKPGKDIWLVGGACVAQEFFKLNLIDEMILTIAPVVLGCGIKLFGDYKTNFKQTKIEVFNQFTSIHYRVEE